MRLLKKRKFYYSQGIYPAPRHAICAAQYVKGTADAALISLLPPVSLAAKPFPLQRCNFDMSPVQRAGSQEVYHFPGTFVLTLPNGHVLDSDGLVLTPDNDLLADVAVHFGRATDKHRIFEHNGLVSPQTVDERIAVLASVDSHVYFHWMCNVLPRLQLLQQSRIEYDQLYLPDLRLPYQKETLAHLGVNFNQVIQGGKGTHLRAKTLLVPSLPAAPCDCPPWVCDFLRAHFLPKLLPTTNRRLYISRSKARRRRVVNEDQVIQTLLRRGFESICLEDLSVLEQATLFASAQAIVAPHGAGLTNLVFCSPGTAVIEYFHPAWVCDCYWQVSNYLSLRHQAMCAKKGYRNLINRLNDRNRDTFIDLLELERKLDSLDISR